MRVKRNRILTFCLRAIASPSRSHFDGSFQRRTMSTIRFEWCPQKTDEPCGRYGSVDRWQRSRAAGLAAEHQVSAAGEWRRFNFGQVIPAVSDVFLDSESSQAGEVGSIPIARSNPSGSAIRTGGWYRAGCDRLFASGPARLGFSCTHPNGRFWGHRVSVRVSAGRGGELVGTTAAMSIRTNRDDRLSVDRAARWGVCKMDSWPEALVCKGLVEARGGIAEIGSGIAGCVLTMVVC